MKRRRLFCSGSGRRPPIFAASARLRFSKESAGQRRKWETRIALLVLPALGLFCAQTVCGDTFIIANGDVAGLKNAIAASNTNGADDVIELAPGGTYALTVVDTSVNGPTGLPRITGDAGHTLTINGNGATITRNNMTPSFRILQLAAGANVSLSRVSLTNGSLTSALSSEGGGILNNGALAMSNCVISGNYLSGYISMTGDSSYGGGISNQGVLTMTDCTIGDNSSYGAGGGSSSPSGFGGGINNNGALALTNCTFFGNRAIGGRSSTGSPGPGMGGGIHNQASMTIANCTFNGNAALVQPGNSSFVAGGAINDEGTAATLTNCTISNNSAVGYSGTFSIAGGGVFGRASTTFRNTIVANNVLVGESGSGPMIGPDVRGTITSQGHNLIRITDGSSGWIANDLIGTMIGPRDPRLSPLGNNGGPTQTMALQPASEAINAADDAVLGPPFLLTTDQRGYPRPIGTHVDIGAFEYDPPQASPTWTVNTTADHDDGNCGVGDCTLREAIIAVNARSGESTQFTILFGLQGASPRTITLTSALPVLSVPRLNLDNSSPGARPLVIRRSPAAGTPQFRVLAIGNGTTINGPTVTITGLTLSNGLAHLPSPGNNGGAIYNDHGNLTLNRCTISDNEATTGGGIANLGFDGTSNLTVVNCTFSRNMTTGSGGALANQLGGLTVANCTFSGNSSQGLGDVIFSSGTGGTASASIVNSIVKAGASGFTFSNVNGTFVSLGHNLCSDAAGGDSGTGPGGFLNGAADRRNTDPQLDPVGPTYRGGTTPVIALLPGSPAINAGDDGRAPVTDQRGFLRNGVSDIGAFEVGGVIPVILANISTRLRVETGDNVLIGGFIVTGTQAKRIIVRAIGPSLPLAGTLANPALELRDSSGGLIRSNDNWRSDQEAEIIATTIPPSNDLEAAIVATLPANNSAYTAIVRGMNNGTGIGVVEAYDLDRTADSRLANISTRGLVQTGDNVLIGGLIILGQNPLRVIVRAIGPSLPVPGALGDPALELRDGNGALIAANDNWRSDQPGEIIATSIAPSNDLESAIVRNLAPGAYTAIVRGVSGATGVALVEAYDLN